jgi:ABC-type nitrate/sulfonate/bicarbonate transport system substrate-binding protein
MKPSPCGGRSAAQFWEEKLNIFNRTGAYALAVLFTAFAPLSAANADKLTLGFPGGVGPTDIPAILALDSLKADGWDTDYIEFDSPDVQTQALLNNDIQIASMGPSTVLAANLAGADLLMVANNNHIDLLITVGAGIESCGDLDGKIVAYHSDGSTSTAHLRRYLKDTCPEAEPKFMVLSGSANRAAALLNEQISGTVVRLEDWIAATKGNEGKGKVLAYLADSQKTLLTQTIVVSGKNIDVNKKIVSDYLSALQQQLDAAVTDPDAFAKAAQPYLKGSDEAQLAGIYRELAERGIFTSDIALTKQEISDTITFYEEAGRAEAGELNPAMVARTDLLGE